MLAIVLIYLSMRGGEEERAIARANDEPLAADDVSNDMVAGETLYVLRQTNMRDRPTSQGSAILRSWTRGDRVTGTWVTGVDPTTRWLRVEQPRGVPGYIWEGNLHTELVDARNPGIVTHDCQGLNCFAGGVRFISRPVRLYGDRFAWNDATHDFGFMAPEGERAEVVEKIVVTWRPGNATLTCNGDYPTWSGDRSWRLGWTPEHLSYSASTPIETLYSIQDGVVAGRAARADSDPDRTGRASFGLNCLRVQSSFSAEDWISLRLPDGRTGWTNDLAALACNGAHDTDARCANLSNR